MSVLLLGITLGCSSSAPGDEQTSGGDGRQADPAALSKSPFWVDPASPAAQQVRQWEGEESTRTADVELMRRISSQPVAEWPNGGEDPGTDVRQTVRGAAAAGRTAVLVAYNIPHRDCGQHSAGGAADVASYQKWIAAFADNIGDNKALVILEPDAIPHVVDGCTPKDLHEERFQLLSESIERLKKHPGVSVYLDAGNSSWIDNPGTLAQPMWKSGIAEADGFALNVSNFQRTEKEIAYGRKLSKLLGDAHFVIDTSRNGNGPMAGGPDTAWCNPPGRALGEVPTTKTGDELVDAFLWIKRPGESDGQCRGGPPAGQWWPDYGLGLARGAAEKEGR